MVYSTCPLPYIVTVQSYLLIQDIAKAFSLLQLPSGKSSDSRVPFHFCLCFVCGFLYYDVSGCFMGKNVLTALEHFSVQTSCFSLFNQGQGDQFPSGRAEFIICYLFLSSTNPSTTFLFINNSLCVSSVWTHHITFP